jgi:hypothetical protein
MLGAKRKQAIHIWLTPLEIRELGERPIGGLMEWHKGSYQGLKLTVAPQDPDDAGVTVMQADNAWHISVASPVWEQLKEYGKVVFPLPGGDTVRLFDISRYRRRSNPG